MFLTSNIGEHAVMFVDEGERVEITIKPLAA